MDIHIYVREDGAEYEVGRMLCPVVPRIGETVYLHMSMAGGWHLNPNNPARINVAKFHVEDVSYVGYNTEGIEDGMGAAPYHSSSETHSVQLYVSAMNEDTQVYINRIIAKGKP